MVEVFVFYNEILGGAGPAYDDGLDVFQVRQPVRACVLSGSLEEIMSRFFDEAFKTLGGLTALPVLSHDVRHEMFLNVDAFARGDAVGGFCTVDHEEGVGFLVHQHLFELRQLESGIASVAERNQRLGWIFDHDVDHSALVVPHDDRSHEDGQPVFAGCFVPREG